MTKQHKAFRKALQHFGGNQSKMAEAIGTTQSRLSYVLRKENALPPDLVLATEAATGITRHDLRPDIYPRETA